MLLSLALDSQFSQEVFVPESDRPSGESTPPYNQDCHGCHGNFVWLLSFFILSSFFASAIPDLPGARPSENLPGRCPAMFRSQCHGVFVFAECLEFSVYLCPLVGAWWAVYQTKSLERKCSRVLIKSRKIFTSLFLAGDTPWSYCDQTS
jgi:hypothetical protein